MLVITKDEEQNVDKLLAKYNENRKVAPYVVYTKEEAIEAGKQFVKQNISFLEYMLEKCEDSYDKQILSGRLAKYQEMSSDDDFYDIIASGFQKEMKKEDGTLMSTVNPDAKWDWYTVGGRYTGILKTKSGEPVDEGCADEIEFDKDVIFPAVITSDGVWHERNRISSFGEYFEAPDKEREWNDKFYEHFIEPAIRNNNYMTVVDCHV